MTSFPGEAMTSVNAAQTTRKECPLDLTQSTLTSITEQILSRSVRVAITLRSLTISEDSLYVVVANKASLE